MIAVEVAAADRVLEERVAGEDELFLAAVPDHEADHVVGVPGRRDRLDLEPAGRQRAHHDRKPELVLVDDMVAVGVRAQDVRCSQVVLAGEGEERLHRRAGVDEHRGPAGLVADDVAVREVLRIEAAGDEHPASLPFEEPAGTSSNSSNASGRRVG